VRLGIDFGTTHTVVATADRGNYPVVPFVDAQGDSHDFVPSMIAERSGELRFGWQAAPCAGRDGWTVVRSFKRLLSDPRATPVDAVLIGGSRVPLGELLVGFLSSVREALPEPPSNAVVAVPANAHGTQRLVTLDAFRRAGFAVRALVNEPSAAGFEYTHRHRATLSAKRDRIVVYDLGGGTFDASLVRMEGRRHEVLTTAGLNRLGGDDFDAALRDLVLRRLGLDGGVIGPVASGRLLERCREAKEALHPNSRKITLDLEEALGEAAPADSVAIPVQDYYEACAPLIERSIDAMLPVMGQLDAEESTATPEDLAGIYVVGGASALPAVGRVLRERFGRRVHRSPYPFAAVAIGLAIAADADAGYELQDRLGRHVGVFREADGGREISFDPVFAKDLPLPPPGERVAFGRRYRASHNLGHYRFAECASIDPSGAATGDLTPCAELLFPFDPALRGDAVELSRVPVARTGAGPLVEERYSLDSDGIVEVTITDLDSGFSRTERFAR
jgi:molecular chaperone DnaK (HSP70)